MSEETIKEENSLSAGQAPSVEKITSKNDVKKLFDGEFASSLNYIYVNSLGKEYGFKEITVMQQKTLSRIMVANENRKDIIYDAQCRLINQSCQSEDFDVYKLTEFDRLKLLIALYQANMFSNDVEFTCKKCGAANRYKFDFGNVLNKLDNLDISDKTAEYENRNLAFKFTLSYPAVKTVADFHKQYCAKHRITNSVQAKNDENISNMEYVNLYIRDVQITNKKNGQKKFIDLSEYPPSDREEIIQMFPQDALYSDNGVLKYIMDKFIKSINDSFDRHKCINCGEFNEGDVNSAESFF